MTAADELRILVVNGESIHSNSPTGITLRAVLAGFRSDQVLELSQIEPEEQPGPGSIPSFTLPPSSQPLRHLTNRLLGAQAVSRGLDSRIRSAELSGASGRVASRTRWRNLARAYLDLGPVRLPPAYRKLIREFAPHVVYTAGCTIGINRLALAAGRVAGVPVLMHYLDNWRESLYAGLSTWLPRRALLRTLARVESGCGAALVISDLMGSNYGRRGTTRYFTLMNAAQLAPYAPPPPRAHGSPLRVVYTGGLHLRRHESMLLVEEAVRAARDEGFACELVIHLSPKDAWIRPRFNPDVTTFAPYVNHGALPEVHADADVLVHAESFDPTVRSFIRYSVSTKISEYLAAGRPVLCYTPHDIALHEYIASSGAGLAPGTPTELKRDLSSLLTDPRLRAKMGARGRLLAATRHTPAAAHETLLAAVDAATAPGVATAPVRAL